MPNFRANASATPAAIARLTGLLDVDHAEITDRGEARWWLKGGLVIEMTPVSDGSTVWSLDVAEAQEQQTGGAS